MDCGKRQHGFTLIELLVVIAIIALLVSLLVPSLSAAREMARKSKCLTNLHAVGVGAALYLHENNDTYWKFTYQVVLPTDTVSYYWDGLDISGGIDTKTSPFMKYLDNDLARLWCPCQPWGSFVPQGGAKEPTTTYGYNQRGLDPGWDSTGTLKKSSEIKHPGLLFVFADSGLVLTNVLMNSHMIVGPKAYGPNTSPTTQFRHLGQTAALCVDGHASGFDLEGGDMPDAVNRLGFVGLTTKASNPHYLDVP
jgi:prepilin-type N-terminal cleavage/methylation domain-containing protein